MNPFWIIKFKLLRGGCQVPGMDVGEALYYVQKLYDEEVARAEAEKARGL